MDWYRVKTKYICWRAVCTSVKGNTVWILKWKCKTIQTDVNSNCEVRKYPPKTDVEFSARDMIQLPKIKKKRVEAQWSAKTTYGTLTLGVFVFEREEKKPLVQTHGGERKKVESGRWWAWVWRSRGGRKRPPICIWGLQKRTVGGGERGSTRVETTGGCEVMLEQMPDSPWRKWKVFTPFLQPSLFRFIQPVSRAGESTWEDAQLSAADHTDKIFDYISYLGISHSDVQSTQEAFGRTFCLSHSSGPIWFVTAIV